MTTYAEWLPSTLTGFLRRHWGARLAYIPALLSDAVRALALEAVRAGIISQAPTDGLPYIGEDRVLEHGIGETAATFRARCQDAWDSWEFAGTEAGMLEQLRAWLPGAGISILTPLDWGGAADFSRIWVVIEKPHPWVPWLVGDGTLVGQFGRTVGSTATVREVKTAQRIVQAWKPAHYRCIHIVVNLSNTPLTLDTAVGTFVGGNPIFWAGKPS